MKYIIANWKAHKNSSNAMEWTKMLVEKINSSDKIKNYLQESRVCIIVCPSFPYITLVKEYIKDLPNIYVGSQDISQFDEGSHTGEVTASMIKDIITYSIVGHSERRKEANESETVIAHKVDELEKNNIKTILCIRNEIDIIYKGASLVAFEPIDAIGSGSNMPVERVIEFKKMLKLSPDQIFIYGGSVNKDDCKEYLDSNEVDGFLIGTASLNVDDFLAIVSKVA